MKKILLFILFLLSTLYVNAQEDYCSKYLERTLEYCQKGEYEQARRWYAVYKDLGCPPKTSIENLLEYNIDNSSKNKIYSVGETMMVDSVAYTVAYIRDGGKHGLAVFNAGWDCPYSDKQYTIYITRKGIPTLEELKLIYANRDIIQLYDIYWTCTPESNSTTNFVIKDFSTGKESTCNYTYKNAVILLIHRF